MEPLNLVKNNLRKLRRNDVPYSECARIDNNGTVTLVNGIIIIELVRFSPDVRNVFIDSKGRNVKVDVARSFPNVAKIIRSKPKDFVGYELDISVKGLIEVLERGVLGNELDFEIRTGNVYLDNYMGGARINVPGVAVQRAEEPIFSFYVQRYTLEHIVRLSKQLREKTVRLSIGGANKNLYATWGPHTMVVAPYTKGVR